MMVRLYTYRGLVAVPVVIYNIALTSTVLLPAQPYLAAQCLDVGEAAVTSDPATAPAGTALIEVETDGRWTVRYEINPPGRTVAASAKSPRLWGANCRMTFGAQWTLSLIMTDSLL